MNNVEKKTIEASIIIPTRDKISRLNLVLRMLEPQIDGNHEVIIIFDGCKQETLKNFDKIDLSFNPVKIISKRNVGRGRARNLGIKKASGNIIIFMDDDRVPCSDYVNKHIEMHKDNHCVVIGKRMQLLLSEGEIISWGKRTPDDKAKELFIFFKKKAKVDFTWIEKKFYMLNKRSTFRWRAFIASNISARREDIIRLGLFDEQLVGWGWEDAELGYRLAKDNIQFIKNSSTVNYHLVHPVDKKKIKMEEQLNYIYFYEKIKDDIKARRFLRAIHFIRKLFC